MCTHVSSVSLDDKDVAAKSLTLPISLRVRYQTPISVKQMEYICALHS